MTPDRHSAQASHMRLRVHARLHEQPSSRPPPNTMVASAVTQKGHHSDVFLLRLTGFVHFPVSYHRATVQIRLGAWYERLGVSPA